MAHRAFVGLSGGVDSAVSAALLKERGFDVCGVFIKIWRPEFIECTWKEDRLDAMRVCAALSIPYREIDLSKEYKQEVVDNMIRDYSNGITPNPDVLCNRSIKFGAFAKWARSQGADVIATGHYARIRQSAAHLELLRGIDDQKDQSYFLHQLGQQDLAHTMFPVGAMRKSEVRERAQALKLPVAHKHDSQGLCFVGDVSMRDFLRRFITVEDGPVFNLEGQKIGEHEGAALYTIGERHGFSASNKQLTQTAHYVVGIDVSKNALTVSEKRSDAEATKAVLSDLHWVHRAPLYGTSMEAQARYREPVTSIILRESSRRDSVLVESAESRIFPPGQSLVFYRGEVCLGGGIIQKTLVKPEHALTAAVFSPEAPVRKIIRRVQ
jgi:tRNA-specific 2-thiouridylase